MRYEFNNIDGRVGVIAAVVLALAALALYLYSERAVPPETESGRLSESEPASGQPRPAMSDAEISDRAKVGESEDLGQPPASSDGDMATAGDLLRSVPNDIETRAEPEISLDRQQQLFREDLAVRLGPSQLEMVAEEQLLERLVTTLNSLDGAPVPLRFRPLSHVPGLPLLASDDDSNNLGLPETPDPRYRPYRAMFDRMDAVELAELFYRYEPALEKAWQALGENAGQTFRERAIEILEHLAEFEVPADRPALHQPKVLYEYADPALEQLSWGRKILVRIGPEHAAAVQRKLSALAERLESASN